MMTKLTIMQDAVAKLFGVSKAPELPYSRAELQELAEQVIRSQTTLTGVQPKLTLDF